MAYEAKILCDSTSPDGHRLVTFEITYPRIVHAEFMTHGIVERNSGSTRATPIEKMVQRVKDDPFIPIHWGVNQKGMQAARELDELTKKDAIRTWLNAGANMVLRVLELAGINVHKQVANRLLEPFLWHTVIATGTEWANFFGLRCHKDAQPEIRHIAEMMRDLYYTGKPEYVDYDDWHLPLTPDLPQLRQTYTEDQTCLIASGRCARVSYLTHHGVRDPSADLELAFRLKDDGHCSPFGHIARPIHQQWKPPYADAGWWDMYTHGKFKGWHQFRKDIPYERDFSSRPVSP